MGSINHFQVYSQRENHVTNNTMLMLKHVYRKSPRLLEGVLQGLLQKDEVEIGPRFEQQVRAERSIPDAVIRQKPLYLYIEAKRGGALSDKQLENHLASIAAEKHPKDSAFLIGLTKSKSDDQKLEKWRDQASKKDVIFVGCTYGEIIDQLGEVCDDDPELKEIFEDYQSFIGAENLSPDQHLKMVAMLCGDSWRENIDHGVYFEPANRNPKWAIARFLGVYHQKKVSHIGRIDAVAVCLKDEQGDLDIQAEEFKTLTEEHKSRISAIMDAAKYYEGFANKPHRYYLVDNFSETDFRKTSPGGMMGHRYFDLTQFGSQETLTTDMPSERVAGILKGQSYE